MSEEIQGKQEREQQQHRSELGLEEEEGSNAIEPEPGGPSRNAPRPGAPGASRLLVEVYGRVVRNLSTSFSPNQVLLDFTKYLVCFRIPTILNFVFNTFSLNRSLLLPSTIVHGNLISSSSSPYSLEQL